METIQISEVINKVSKANKPYKVFTTSAGQVSAFDTAIVEAMEKAIGKSLDVEIVARNGFLNVTKVYGEAKPQAEKVQASQITVAQAVEGKCDVVIENYCKAMQSLLMKVASKQA